MRSLKALKAFLKILTSPAILSQALGLPAIVGILLLSYASTTLSEAVSIRASADTTLFESSPGDNMGGWTHVAAGTTGNAGDRTRNRGLFRFDIAAALPANAKITNALLKLQVVRIPGSMGGGGSAGSTFVLHRLLKPWGEGDKLGDRGFPADAGEATWNDRFAPDANGVGGQAWTAPGGGSPGDYSSSVSASRMVSGLGAYQFGPTSNLVADVQNWLDDARANFGWILISQSENVAKTARAFGSREDTNHPPTLVVEYTAANTLKIDRLERVGPEIQFSFAADAGQSYVVQVRSSLTTDSWQTFTNLNRQAASTNVVVKDLISGTARFYRVGKL